MDHAHAEDILSDAISIARWRELLGEDAEGLSEDEVEQIRRHADAMGHVIIEMFLERTTTSESLAMARVQTTLPALRNGSTLRPMIGAVIYVRVSTMEQIENLSLPTQLKACEEYCGRHGLKSLSASRKRATAPRPRTAPNSRSCSSIPAPLGYLNAPKWSGKSLVPDPDRAPLVKQMFEDFATGRFTKQEVLARVTERGLRTRRGLVLSPQSSGQMLRNTIYIGLMRVPNTESQRVETSSRS